MVDHKPLPAIPPSNGNDTSLTILSIDARAHRSRLLRHFLSEINEPGIDSKRDMWVSVFEDVLDEMGACVKEDSWLREIRKMRETQRQKRRAEKGKGKEAMVKGEALKLKKIVKTQSSGSGSGSGAAEAHSAGHEVAHKKDGQPSEDSFTTTAANDPTNLIESPSSVSEELAEKRLVLCVTPWRNQASVLAEDNGFARVPHKVRIGCVFTSGKFAFQDTTVLYGTVSPSLQNVLGGSFTFKNLTSQLQHTLLSKLLRVAVYIHLSLILEQHLLHDSHVHIVFPAPKPLSFPTLYSALVPDQPASNLPQTTAHDQKQPMSRKLRSLVPSNILSFFSRKGIPHSTTVMPVLGSDLGLPITLPGQPQLELWRESPSKSPRSSIDTGGGRLRTLSFLGNGDARRPSSRGKEVENDSHGSLSYAATATASGSTFSTSSTTSTSHISFSFSATLAHIKTSCSLLSTSPGVVFPAPSLIVDLAEKEKKNPHRRLKGDERAGLGSLLGWETSVHGHVKNDKDKDPSTTPNIALKGSGMTGIQGFLRHQALSVLVSHHVPLAGPAEKDKDKEKEVKPNTASSYIQFARPYLFTTCGRPRWRTLRYFSHSGLDSQSPTAVIARSGRDGDVEKDGGAEKDEKSKDKDKDRGGDRDKDKDDGDKGEHENQTLGDTIRDWVENSEERCSRSECTAKNGKHQIRYVHGGVKVTINVNGGDRSEVMDNGEEALGDEQNATKRDNIIKMWESCTVCHAHTKKNIMSDGTYLLSFGKFLELLVYSPSLCVQHAPLCAHTSPPPKPWPLLSLPEERLNIVRHFSAVPSSSLHPMQDGEREVSFTLSPVDHVFELRVPRLQITAFLASSSREKEKCPLNAAGVEEKEKYNDRDADKKELRREIKRWWEGIADHVDALETMLQNTSANEGEGEDCVSPSLLRRGHKSLPRLPSADEAYEYGYDDANEYNYEGFGLSPDETDKTPRGGAVVPLPSPSMDSGSGSGSRDGTVSSTHQDLVDDLNSPRTGNTIDTSMSTPPFTLSSELMPSSFNAQAPPPPSFVPSALDLPAYRLSALRHTFHRTEHSLYAQLARTPPGSLNDVRRAFLYAATGAGRRLWAWQRKHVWNSERSGGAEAGGGTATGGARSVSDQRGALGVEEPEWWGKKCHVLPGGSVVVREDDWGSIIAFTLSTADYQHELSSMLVTRTHSSFITATPQPQPITTPSVPDTPTGQSSSSFFSAAMSYKLFTSSTPTLPDPDQEDVAWSEPEAFSAVISRKEHPKDTTTLLAFREVLRQKSPVDLPGSSILSATSRINNSSTGTSTGGGGSTPKAGGSTHATGSGSGAVPPSAWAKPDVQISKDAAGGKVSVIPPDTVEAAERILQEIEAESLKSGSASLRSGKAASEVSDATIGRDGEGLMRTIVTMGPPPTPPAKSDMPERQARRMDTQVSQATSSDVSGATASSFTNTLTSGFSNVMRYMLHGQELSRPSSPVSKSHHGLLSIDTAACIDERPHIKYDWTVGKRLKFSCTVYYARQFDVLRRRCAVNDVFVRSLSRSANWAADGGKSKSKFWKTQDERFIIKTLVDAWNVADLQFLLELAPSYFRYMDATASKATVLAKMMGFYTIEIRNLETGGVQSKADLLVMENLFYDQKVTKTFDLKGIQGRKVKPAKVTQSSKTLFDGEWIDGQQKTLMLVHPHSKEVLRAAIRSDAEFLSRSNIMDYSLLVGVDEEQKQIACGLVDTIGSYTFAKTLEYKAKHGLNSGKEVTVMPPAEYQDRFVRALERYFLACPDKWSKPLEEWRIPNDPSQLPSVL